MAQAKQEGKRAGKKKAGSVNCLPGKKSLDLDVGLGLAQALDAVARFPLATLLEQVHALEAFQDIALND
jgi:hypothetical protein